ncbi:ankyrin repeat protein-like protein [Leptotrombidium deliense]|uniref:Alpha-latrotoxin n=1 Tax=Leptotrombidium deliense TaxID=299467 RepID=A0A443RX44_9ACAR|nr:ankyrin repeat protein-like protein [Leptotrombidium deliense]
MDAKNASFLYLSSIGEIQVVRKLIAQGIDVNMRDCDGNTALHMAAKENRVEVLNLLLENGAFVNALNENGDSALHVSIQSKAIESIQLLLHNQIDVNCFNNEKCSALMCAMAIGSRETLTAAEIMLRNKIIELLIRHENIDLRCVTSHARKIFEGSNYLFYAIRLGNYFVVKQILEKDPSLLEISDAYGDYPIHRAAINNRLEILKLILSIDGGFLNARGLHKMTPLYYAVRHQSFDVIAYLLQQKANSNLATLEGYTSLHSALHEYLVCCSNNANDCKYDAPEIFRPNLVDFKKKCANLAVAVYLIENCFVQYSRKLNNKSFNFL